MLLETLKLAEFNGKELFYGSSGYRSNANNLSCAMLRIGIVAAVVSSHYDGKPSGIMITASHNPACDNGVKLVEPSGKAIDPKFIPFVTDIVNAKTNSDCEKQIQKFVKAFGKSVKGVVFIGYDGRESSERFSKLVEAGAKAMNADAHCFGLMSTPVLHWITKYTNYGYKIIGKDNAGAIQVYIDYFKNRLQEFIKIAKVNVSSKSKRLTVDCAHGVGSHVISKMHDVFKLLNYELEVRNPVDPVELNVGCGSDFVHKNLTFPKNFATSDKNLCAALDGDADRVVFFSSDANSKLLFQDGDRISSLYLLGLTQILNKIISKATKTPSRKLNLSVVQTAYSNGLSTKYFENLKFDTKYIEFQTRIAKTGVANLHRLAEEADLSVFFESNGHGTIHYEMHDVQQWFNELQVSDSGLMEELKSYLLLINETVGDAIVDVLVALSTLEMLRIDINKWASLYPELSVRQETIHLDRKYLNQLKCVQPHEMWLLEPKDLQDKVNELVKKYKNARAFIRPSGTEDVCRIYVESEQVESSNEIGAILKKMVVDYFKTSK